MKTKKVAARLSPARRRPAKGKAKAKVKVKVKVKGATVRVSRSKDAEAEQTKAQQRQAKRMLRPAGCRSFMRRQLADKFPAIVEGFVKAAKTGSVPHVKLATELLKPTRQGSTRRKGTVAKLLEKLKRNEPFETDEPAHWPAAEEAEPTDGGNSSCQSAVS